MLGVRAHERDVAGEMSAFHPKLSRQRSTHCGP
jgi:hypothetical protein